MDAVARHLVVAAMILAAGPGPATARDAAALEYEIDAVLDPATHRITAHQRLRWVNTQGVSASELRFHLYLNAFASEGTTFARSLQPGLADGPPAAASGWIRVDRIVTTGGRALELEWRRPDDGNPEDRTVARAVLPRPVPPGDAVELEIDFECQLPRVIARSGYAGDFHMVAQWFPKLGVWQGERGWSCHQYHANTEFFADFAAYRVVLDVPAGWRVAATGIEVGRLGPAEHEPGRQLVRYRAEKVHDFAWCAAPGELVTVLEGRFDPARDVPRGWLLDAAERLEMSPADLELPPTHLRLMIPTRQADHGDRILESVRAAIAWYGLAFGPYPYPQLTLVAPPLAAAAAGGMEYPTLITLYPAEIRDWPVLSALPLLEAVAVHEYGHQYFYGVVATNEAEAAWLDEGLTTFTEGRCLQAMAEVGMMAGAGVRLLQLADRLRLRRLHIPTVVDRPAAEFRNPATYSAASYSRASLALATLEGLIGGEAFARGLRRYVENHAFSHPTGEDLQAALEEAAGGNLAWFFDQALRSDHTVDWVVLDDESRCDTSSGDGEDASACSASVEVGRRGEMTGPVEVALVFADGEVEQRLWEGRERWVRWRLDSDSPLTRVVVDPDWVWALETHRADNRWSAEVEAPSARWWVGEAMRLLLRLPLPWS